MKMCGMQHWHPVSLDLRSKATRHRGLLETIRELRRDKNQGINLNGTGA